MDASHHATERTVDSNEPIDVTHDQTNFILEAQLQLELGLVDHVAVGLELPVRLFDTSVRYLDHDGREVKIQNDDVHHRNETLFGFGDPLLQAHAGWSFGGSPSVPHRHIPAVPDPWAFDIRLGLRLPVGETQPDPFTPEAEAAPHQHFQFGTGTFDPVLSLSLEHDFGPLALALWTETRQTLYANSYGYEAGDRYAVGLVANSALGLDDWSFSLGVDLQVETPERWSEDVPTDDGNRGRTDVLTSLGVVYRVSDAFWFGLNARVPLYTYVVGGQLEFPVLLELSLGGSATVFE